MKLLDLCKIKDEDGIELSSNKGSLLDDCYNYGKYVVLVEKGEVSVKSIASDEKETLLSTLEKGDVFGICNLFAEEDLPTLLEARTECILKLYPKDLLRNRILENPDAMKEYGILCNKKLQFLLRRIEELSGMSTKNKVISYLLKEDGDVISKRKTTIASSLGISRASLYRELGALEKEGLIKIAKAGIEIKNRKKLKEMCVYL